MAVACEWRRRSSTLTTTGCERWHRRYDDGAKQDQRFADDSAGSMTRSASSGTLMWYEHESWRANSSQRCATRSPTGLRPTLALQVIWPPWCGPALAPTAARTLWGSTPLWTATSTPTARWAFGASRLRAPYSSTSAITPTRPPGSIQTRGYSRKRPLQMQRSISPEMCWEGWAKNYRVTATATDRSVTTTPRMWAPRSRTWWLETLRLLADAIVDFGINFFVQVTLCCPASAMELVAGAPRNMTETLCAAWSSSLLELAMDFSGAMVRFAGFPAGKRLELSLSLGLSNCSVNVWCYDDSDNDYDMSGRRLSPSSPSSSGGSGG
mmetsp:Transcript_63499/g.177691  ORF Transcript_63499/g.177691 Transcript_63499/m.177691 type:complete len:324 (+) Transcript_63499:78-1049(+)